MNAADQGGRARSLVDARVVELAAYRKGKDEPHVGIGRAADIPAALALAEARHQDCRLAVLPWSKSKAAALFELAVHHGDCLLLVAEHEEAIVGIFLGMAAPYYFSAGQVSTDLAFVLAPPFRRKSEEHTSALPPLMRTSSPFFCLKHTQPTLTQPQLKTL